MISLNFLSATVLRMSIRIHDGEAHFTHTVTTEICPKRKCQPPKNLISTKVKNPEKGSASLSFLRTALVCLCNHRS